MPSLMRNPRFQGAQPDHVRVQSSSCCFPRELVSFIRSRELASFNPRHMTRSPPIGNVSDLGGITRFICMSIKELHAWP